MSYHDEEYMNDYDYYQNTGELSEYFEDDDQEDDDQEDDDEDDEEEEEDEQQNQNTMTNIKLKHLNELTEIDDAAAAKYGVELKSFVFRNIYDCLTLYMEFAAIEGRRPKGDLIIDAVLYDKEGDIFNSQTEFIEASYFKGFEVIKFEFDDIQPSDVGRIKIHMKKG